MEAADKERADQNADEEGRIGFLGDEGQDNGHNGGHKGPESTSHVFFLRNKKYHEQSTKLFMTNSKSDSAPLSRQSAESSPASQA